MSNLHLRLVDVIEVVSLLLRLPNEEDYGEHSHHQGVYRTHEELVPQDVVVCYANATHDHWNLTQYHTYPIHGVEWG